MFPFKCLDLVALLLSLSLSPFPPGYQYASKRQLHINGSYCNLIEEPSSIFVSLSFPPSDQYVSKYYISMVAIGIQFLSLSLPPW